MEDVLETSKLPFNPVRPVVCLDETSRQLIGETGKPLPARPGQAVIYDYEYVRNGAADLFMMLEPLSGRREVKVSQSRTRQDFAACLRDLAYTRYREAEKIVPVMDNLNTHTLASLYAAFPPSEARSLAERFEIRYTPKHGSWLNMAEMEIGILSRQCLNRRIGTIERNSGIYIRNFRLRGVLGIKAASLYNHFKDKQSLYNALSEKICAEMRPFCGLVDAKGYLMENALLYRKGLLKVRDAVKILAASPPLTPIRAELTKNALLCLLRLGIKDENCIVAGRLFNNYVLSFASDETAILDEGWTKANPYIAIFGMDYKPIGNDEQFLRGLNVLFVGFKTLE